MPAGPTMDTMEAMSVRRGSALVVLCGLTLGAGVGCGGRELSKPDGSAGMAGAAGMMGSAGVAGHEECTSDRDCPPIECLVAHCPEALCARGADGLRRCTSRTHPPIPPCPAGDASCCRSDEECPAMQSCLSASGGILQCGGIPSIGNGCTADRCRSDSDCTEMPNGACTATYPRVCGYGPCRTNADCTQGPGGVCVVDLINGPCVVPLVFCRYSNDPCRTDADCPGSPAKICAPGPGLAGARCAEKPAPPP
jgi:hypothetical protein